MRKSRDWFVICSHFGEEHTASRNLSAQGHEVYLPLMRLPRNIRTGVRRAVPLFEGYLFIRETPTWKNANGTRGVQRVITYSCGKRGDDVLPSRVLDRDISAIRRCEDELGYLPAEPTDWVSSEARLRVGDIVSPRSGPWTGQLGRILELSAAQRCVVLFEMLGRGVRVTTRTSELAVGL